MARARRAILADCRFETNIFGASDNQSTMRGAAMAIRFDDAQRRAVDDQTGEYLVHEFWHYQSPTHDYTLHAADGTKLGVITVEQTAEDRIGDGTANFVTVRLVSARLRSEDGSYELADVASPQVQRLVDFLRAYLHGEVRIERTVEISTDGLGGVGQ